MPTPEASAALEPDADASTDDWARLLGGLRHWYRLVGGASVRARAVEHEGVLATVVPAAPERALFNGVVYESGAALVRALPRLARMYAEAGIEAWTVWVPPGDPAVRDALRAAGSVLDAAPAAMIRELERVQRPPPDALADWTADGDVAVAARINDRSYPFGTNSFERGLDGLSRDAVHVYLARLDGEPVAAAVTSDADGNCEVDCVAALPEARGRGIATALVGHALADAAARGCDTSTLVATALGRPVYERLGYRSLGRIEMWERRQAVE